MARVDTKVTMAIVDLIKPNPKLDSNPNIINNA